MPSPDGQCHMVFTGLEKTGHDFRSLRVTAQFGVDSVHKVGKVTGPIKASLEQTPDRPKLPVLTVLHLLTFCDWKIILGGKTA